MKIVFGTDGWRGVIARDFTFERVAIVTQGIANQVRKTGNRRGILVGYDTRFLSREFAELSAAVLANNGISVLFSEEPVPTPVVSFGVRRFQLDGAVMITASHNPFMFNGIKFKGDYGGSALPSFTKAVEEDINSGALKVNNNLSFKEFINSNKIRLINLKNEYLKQLKRIIDFKLLEKHKKKVVIDPMYGAGYKYLPIVFKEVLGWDVIPIRAEINPSFGGYNPEPCLPNILPLIKTVIERRAKMGFAVDGDADRIGAVDEKGNFIDSHKIFALTLRYLVEKKGWRGDVAKTVTVSDMVQKLSEKYGLKTHTTPVGFKHICNLMLKGDILMGGEESGGIGITKHMPERDGILNALLLAEMSIAYNKPLSRLVKDLMDFIGFHIFKRVDLHIRSREQLDRFLSDFSPETIAGLRVKKIDALDGKKIIFEDSSWLMFRLSGTEPVLRIYCESNSEKRLNQLIKSAKDFVAEYL